MEKEEIMTEQEIRERFEQKYGKVYEITDISWTPWGAYIYATDKATGTRHKTFTIDF